MFTFSVGLVRKRAKHPGTSHMFRTLTNVHFLGSLDIVIWLNVQNVRAPHICSLSMYSSYWLVSAFSRHFQTTAATTIINIHIFALKETKETRIWEGERNSDREDMRPQVLHSDRGSDPLISSTERVDAKSFPVITHCCLLWAEPSSVFYSKGCICFNVFLFCGSESF